MDFTREPIIETVITPREGFKLVVRSSKAVGQEEYFVDAVEVVAFGHALFFRSTEKPRAFLVPTTDYEVLEVREARMVLKHVAIDRSIKIGGGREAKAPREEKEAPPRQPRIAQESEAPLATPADAPTASTEEGRYDRKRERRRHLRRRRSRDEREGSATAQATEETSEESLVTPLQEEPRVPILPPSEVEGANEESQVISSSILSSLLPPPPNLIRETIARYKKNKKFRGAFIGEIEEEREGPIASETPLLPEEEGPPVEEEPIASETIVSEAVASEPMSDQRSDEENNTVTTHHQEP